MDQQKEEFDQEMTFKLDRAETSDERWEAMREMWDKYWGEESGETPSPSNFMENGEGGNGGDGDE